MGLLEPEYDLPLQIDAMAEVLARHPNAGLAIVGSGSREESLRERIDAKPYRDRILLCGDVAHEATLRAIAASDVVLRTTLYDGDSVSVREALAFGKPVIATDNGMRPAGVRLMPARDGEAGRWRRSTRRWRGMVGVRARAAAKRIWRRWSGFTGSAGLRRGGSIRNEQSLVG